MASEVQRKGFGYFLFACVVVAVIYVIWAGYKRWRTVRQFEIMEQQNAQIDSVLEDMDLDQSASIAELEDVVDGECDFGDDNHNGHNGHNHNGSGHVRVPYRDNDEDDDDDDDDDVDIELDNMKPSSSRRRGSKDDAPNSVRVDTVGSDIL
jgi:hypothetical protein